MSFPGIAAHQDGSLRQAAAREAARLRQLGTLTNGIGSDLSAEEHAMLACVEELIEVTPDPDRASDPADEPVIERLLAATGGREYRMAAILLAAGQDAVASELPPGVTPPHGHRDPEARSASATGPSRSCPSQTELH